MNIVISKNSSDKHVVTKSVTDLATLSGTLRERCSVVDPVVKVEGLTAAQAAECNYAYIADFGRYYYINDIIFDGKLYELHMHCDVLMTYKSQFLSQEAVIARQENSYNLYLQDGLFKTYQKPHVSVKQFPTGFSGYHYILCVAGA